jgi:hypothetical protein
VLVLGALSGSPAEAAPRFNAAVNYGAGSKPRAVAVGEFIRNGIPDIAVANSNSGNVSVLLGRGHGTFAAAVNYPVGANPVAVQSADVNNDGKLDLVTANANGTISVLLGNGNGTFQAPANFTVGGEGGESGRQAGELDDLVLGDFNNDGRVDIAALWGSDESVYILLGNGNGTFQRAKRHEVPGFPTSIAAGALAGGNHLDLVSADSASGEVSVLLGNGSGGFGSPTSYPAGTWPGSVVVANLNPRTDSFPDVAVSNSPTGKVSVLLGKGDGTLGSSVSYPSGGGGVGLIGASFDGDQYTDLATSNESTGMVSVLPGNGYGAFGSPVSFATGEEPVGLGAAEIGGTTGADLFAANSGAGTVSVLLGPAVILSAESEYFEFGSRSLASPFITEATTITNTGDSPTLPIGVRSSSTGVFPAVIDSCAGATLAPGATCSFGIRYQPTLPKNYSGDSTFEYGGAGPLTIEYFGQAREAPSASSKPVECSLAKRECSSLLELVADGIISNETLINNGVLISVSCNAALSSACKVTILLYGTTFVNEILLEGLEETGRHPGLDAVISSHSKSAHRHSRSSKKHPKRVLLGEEVLQLSAGKALRSHLKLTSEGKKLLRGVKHAATLELVTEAKGSSGKTMTSTKKIQVRVARPRKRSKR